MTDFDCRPIPGFPDYEVRRDGAVFTLKRKARRPLAFQIDEDGHHKVELWQSAERRVMFVHTAVLLAFVGPRPDGMEGCHNDGNPSNNTVENLRWDTPQSNQADRLRHGTDSRGSKHGCAKLIERQVIEIIESKEASKSLARRYGVSLGTIYGIKNRKEWRHIHAQLAASA